MTRRQGVHLRLSSIFSRNRLFVFSFWVRRLKISSKSFSRSRGQVVLSDVVVVLNPCIPAAESHFSDSGFDLPVANKYIKQEFILSPSYPWPKQNRLCLFRMWSRLHPLARPVQRVQGMEHHHRGATGVTTPGKSARYTGYAGAVGSQVQTLAEIATTEIPVSARASRSWTAYSVAAWSLVRPFSSAATPGRQVDPVAADHVRPGAAHEDPLCDR